MIRFLLRKKDGGRRCSPDGVDYVLRRDNALSKVAKGYVLRGRNSIIREKKYVRFSKERAVRTPCTRFSVGTRGACHERIGYTV